MTCTGSVVKIILAGYAVIKLYFDETIERIGYYFIVSILTCDRASFFTQINRRFCRNQQFPNTRCHEVKWTCDNQKWNMKHFAPRLYERPMTLVVTSLYSWNPHFFFKLNTLYLFFNILLVSYTRSHLIFKAATDGVCLIEHCLN